MTFCVIIGLQKYLHRSVILMDLHEREKNVAFYEKEQTVIDQVTGEVLSSTIETVAKTSAEPDFVKVYYETMLAFNQIHGVPVTFVLSLSRFIEFSNDGSPLFATLNKRVKLLMVGDCKVSFRQIERYIKVALEQGLLFKTEFRGVYEVNPFMIAKGKWDSIKRLRAKFDFVDGKWERTITSIPDNQT